MSLQLPYLRIGEVHIRVLSVSKGAHTNRAIRSDGVGDNFEEFSIDEQCYSGSLSDDPDDIVYVSPHVNSGTEAISSLGANEIEVVTVNADIEAEEVLKFFAASNEDATPIPMNNVRPNGIDEVRER